VVHDLAREIKKLYEPLEPGSAVMLWSVVQGGDELQIFPGRQRFEDGTSVSGT